MVTMEVALSRYSQELLELYPADLRNAMAAELDELLLDGVELAREVCAAEARGLSFAQASTCAEYPRMARVHYGLLDVLQLEFEPEERGVLERVLGRAAGLNADALRRRWFLTAAEQPDSLAGALMRYLLYQAMRLNVWILTWHGGAPLEASGALRRLDDEAERQLRSRLAQPDMQDPAVRPLQILVAEAIESLDHIWNQRKAELASAQPDGFQLFEGLTRAASVARNLNAADAALVRNELEGALGGEQLGSAPLAARQPLALASQNATDQRRRRLLAKLSADADPQPSGARLIDLIVERGANPTSTTAKR
jgi:hypothetical protein